MKPFLVCVGVALVLLLVFGPSTCRAKAAPETFCSWDHPGAHKYQPYPSKALDDYYMDFQVRAELKAKMEAHQYDDVITIRRDGVFGHGVYSNLREMHYGRGMVCPGRVDTSSWDLSQVERALVYCSGSTCVAVPTVCNNVSLIDREEEGTGQLGAGPGIPSGNPEPSGDASPDEPGPVPSDSPPEAEEPPTLGPEEPGPWLPGFVVPGWSEGGGPGYPGFPGGPGCGCTPPPPPVCPPPIPSVPESPEWAMILAGILSFLWLWSRRDKHK